MRERFPSEIQRQRNLMLATLRVWEWSESMSDDDYGACPACWQINPERSGCAPDSSIGHKPDCPLDAFIRRLEERKFQK